MFIEMCIYCLYPMVTILQIYQLTQHVKEGGAIQKNENKYLHVLFKNMCHFTENSMYGSFLCTYILMTRNTHVQMIQFVAGYILRWLQFEKNNQLQFAAGCMLFK